jgi:hypothetical protein
MNARFLILGTIVGGVVIFLWGAVTHAVLPQPLTPFKDEPALVEAVRAHTAGNGVYFATRGIFAAVAFRPDFADKTQNLPSNLIVQLLTDTLAALLLCFVVTGVQSGTVLGRAGWLTLVGLGAFALKELPYWNWYGFSPPFVAMEALDLIGKFFIAGLVLSALLNRTVKTKAAHA